MPLRAASRIAGGSAAAALPPAPITDTNMNCDAPVNATSDITHVCSTLKPAATDSTPNDTAYTPVARPMERESRSRRSGTDDILARDAGAEWQIGRLDELL